MAEPLNPAVLPNQILAVPGNPDAPQNLDAPQNPDVLQNLDDIQNLNFLQDLDVLQNPDAPQNPAIPQNLDVPPNPSAPQNLDLPPNPAVDVPQSPAPVRRRRKLRENVVFRYPTLALPGPELAEILCVVCRKSGETV